MGQGIDLARDIAPEHAAAIDNLKDQLLLVLVQRLGGNVTIPVMEIDDTGGLFMEMRLDQNKQEFQFVVKKKS